MMPYGSIPYASLPPGLDASVPNPLEALLASSLERRSYLLWARPTDTGSPILDDLGSPILDDDAEPILSDAGVIDLYASSDKYASGPTDTLPDGTSLPNQLFRAPLIQSLRLENRVMQNGRLGSGSVPAAGDVVVANPDGAFNSWIHYQWNDASITTFLGRPEWPLQRFGAIFNGAAEALHGADTTTLSIAIRDLSKRLRKPVQTAVYRGMGAALRGNGTDTTGSVTLSAPAGSMTLEGYLRPKTSANALKYFAGWQSSSAAGYRALRFVTGAVNRFEARVIADDGTQFAASTDGLGLGEMIHVALVLDLDAMLLRLVINGSTVATADVTGRSFSTVLSTFRVLRRPDSAANFLDGDVDEIRIWSAALSDDEIQANRFREIDPATTGLVAYWRFNEGTGSTAFDSTAGAHDLALVGTVSWVGSLEGGADIAGQPPPKWWGKRREAQGVLVDPQNNVFEFSRSPSNALYDLADKGSTSGITLDSDVDDVYGWTPVAGKYVTSLSGTRTLVRLYSAPQGTLTATIEGDNTGGYVDTTADIIKRLATTEGGLASTDLDLSAFASAATNYPQTVGIGIRLENPTVWDLIQDLAIKAGGWATFTRSGLLTFAILTPPGTPRFYLTEEDIEPEGISRIVATPAVKQTVLGYRPYATEQSESTLATDLTTAQKSDLSQRYRYTPTPVSASVLASNPSAGVLNEDTYYDSEADANAEAVRRQVIWSVERITYRLPLVQGLFQYSLGDDISLSVRSQNGTFLHDFDGKLMKIVGYVEIPERDTIQLEVWG